MQNFAAELISCPQLGQRRVPCPFWEGAACSWDSVSGVSALFSSMCSDCWSSDSESGVSPATCAEAAGAEAPFCGLDDWDAGASDAGACWSKTESGIFVPQTMQNLSPGRRGAPQFGHVLDWEVDAELAAVCVEDGAAEVDIGVEISLFNDSISLPASARC